MISLTRTFRRAFGGGSDAPTADTRAPSRARVLETPPIDIAANDPILAYFHAGSGAVAIDDLELDSPAVRALRGAGIAVVVVADNLNPRDGAWRCLSGSFRLARVEQQQPAPVARPGDRPSVDILLFSSAAERAAAEASIGTDGQVRAAGCGTMVDWVAPPPYRRGGKRSPLHRHR